MSNVAVTAKVFLSAKTEGEYGTNLSFYADYGDGRNQEWAVATPNISVSMTVKPEVGDLFELSKGYTLTFAPES